MSSRRQAEALYARLPINQALALERTVLANERTWLAYARTAMAVIIAGVTAAEFLDGPAFRVVGYVVAGVGVVLLAWGVWRYRSSQRTMIGLFERLDGE